MSQIFIEVFSHNRTLLIFLIIEVWTKHVNKKVCKGLYCDSSIGISENLDTVEERTCVLAEELGHHYTTVGNILDMTNISNRKQERQARMWGYDKLIGPRRLIEAYEHGCRDRYELAEYLEVTDEYLQECIDCYRDKYGVCTTVDDYCIMFIPNLQVGKII